MADKLTKKFSVVYGAVYNALYECDRNDELVDYGYLVGVSEILVKRNEQYKELVRAYFEHAGDVPTSDRELAAFLLAAMGVSDIWDAIIECEDGTAEGRCA